MKPKKTKKRILIRRKINVTPEQISYKNYQFLYQFVSEQGAIVPRAVTGIALKNQRLLAREVKRARHLALLQYTQTI